MIRKYLVLLILAIVSAGCSGAGGSIGGQAPPPSTATAASFNVYTAQEVFDALQAAGLNVQNPQREMLVGRGAPSSFSDRHIFEIDVVAPAGGQILIFDTPEALAEWNRYIERLRASSETRRDVSYVYVNGNSVTLLDPNAPQGSVQVLRKKPSSPNPYSAASLTWRRGARNGFLKSLSTWERDLG